MFLPVPEVLLLEHDSRSVLRPLSLAFCLAFSILYTTFLGSDFLRRIRGLYPRRGVRETDLHAHEARFLASIRESLAPGGVEFCEGEGAVVRTASALVVPRSNPAVEAARQLVADQPAWIYPALLALDTGEEVPDETRRAWMRAFGVI